MSYNRVLLFRVDQRTNSNFREFWPAYGKKIIIKRKTCNLSCVLPGRHYIKIMSREPTNMQPLAIATLVGFTPNSRNTNRTTVWNHAILFIRLHRDATNTAKALVLFLFLCKETWVSAWDSPGLTLGLSRLFLNSAVHINISTFSEFIFFFFFLIFFFLFL